MDGRTDLAMEAYALWKQDAQDTTQLPGVKAREEDAGGVYITSGGRRRSASRSGAM